VFEMQEIVEGVVEIPFGTEGSAGWRACGTVRSWPPRRCRRERGRTPKLSASRWGMRARVGVQIGTGSRTPLRLGTFQLPKPI